MEFQTLRKELKDGTRHKVYVFHGEEREVLYQYVSKVADGSPILRHTNYTSMVPHLLTKSLIHAHRVFTLYGSTEVLEMSFEALQNMVPDYHTLIVIFDSIDKRRKFFLDASDYTVEFRRFTTDELRQYVRTKLAITDKLATLLVEWCGNDVARIDSEIDKLKRIGTNVTYDILLQLVPPTPEDTVFEMIDALALKEMDRVFDMYEDQIQLGESPVKLVALLYTKFRQMFLVQSMMDLDDGQIASKTHLNKWVVGRVREVLGHFSLQQLMDALRLAQQTEVDIKTGKVNPDMGFQRLILGVGQNGAQ